jgi:hypothetical protein
LCDQGKNYGLMPLNFQGISGPCGNNARPNMANSLHRIPSIFAGFPGLLLGLPLEGIDVVTRSMFG